MMRMALLFCIALTCACTRPRSDMQPAVGALRKAYAAFNRGDIAATTEALDANIEWTEPAEFPGGGTYHGHEGVKAYLTQTRAAWAECNSDPEQFIPAGDKIVVFVHARVRPKGSNNWSEVRLADCRHLPRRQGDPDARLCRSPSST